MLEKLSPSFFFKRNSFSIISIRELPYMLEGLFPSPGWSWIEIIVATITIIVVIIITIFKNPTSQWEVLTKGVSPESLLESACWYQRESLNAWYQFHCNCQCCHYNHNLSFLVIVVIDDIIDLLILAGVCMYRFAKIKQRKIKHLIKLSVEYTNHDYPHDDVIQFHDNHYYHHYAWYSLSL